MWTKRLSVVAMVYITAITIINCDGGSDSEIKVGIDASGQDSGVKKGSDASQSNDARPTDSQSDTSQPNEQLDASPLDGQSDTSQPNEQPDASQPNGQTVTYCNDIQPLLVQYCTSCHSEADSLHGIRLDSYAEAMANASASKQEIQIGTMPMGTTMPDPDKALFNDWVDQGTLECDSSM